MILTFYWMPPTKGASPQRLKIWNAKGAIIQVEAIWMNGFWKYLVDDCVENRRWIALAAPDSGWSLEPPKEKAEPAKPAEPEIKNDPEPKMEIADTLPPPPQRKRVRSARRMNEPRIVT